MVANNIHLYTCSFLLQIWQYNIHSVDGSPICTQAAYPPAMSVIPVKPYKSSSHLICL